jgi:hypothetical protein
MSEEDASDAQMVDIRGDRLFVRHILSDIFNSGISSTNINAVSRTSAISRRADTRLPCL